MIALGTMLVSLVAVVGWLYLNWRAVQSHRLSFETKAAMAAGWVSIFVVLAFALTRMGF